MENIGKLTENKNESHIVFGGVHCDQYASDFDEHSRKTLDRTELTENNIT